MTSSDIHLWVDFFTHPFVLFLIGLICLLMYVTYLEERN